MDTLTNDDELLLMELERRDGIYSFIFHELENNKDKMQQESKMNNQIDTNAIKQIKTEILTTTTKETTFQQTNNIEFSLKSERSILPNDFATHSNSSIRSSTSIFQDSFALSKIRILHGNSNAETSLNFKQQMSSLQQLCSLRSLNVRKAKSPFSYLYEPMVRNRRHKLKETKEYKNFMRDKTKVADLRNLFPLDPDVHAPFLVNPKNL